MPLAGNMCSAVPTMDARIPDVPRLSAIHWPAAGGPYPRSTLPVRVLQFGTGMLLRALCAASVDSANRTGAFRGRIVVVQSTPQGQAAAINAQDGLFTLVERGLENGASVERTRLIGSLARAVVADTDWPAVRALVTRPELQVIVSNVTEAGFRADGPLPARLVDLLHVRYTELPDGPTLFVVPTELVDDNGPLLAAMVARLAPDRAFRGWLQRHVRFCSSLVDRITTGLPAPADRAELASRLGYSDALLTVAEPYAFWAIEGDPAELRAAFPIDGSAVVFATDIRAYGERKLRLLNGAHTVTAPVALLAGVRTVREAAEHPRLGPFLRQVLFDELVPGTDLPTDAAATFARGVLDRFRNPWLEHEWRVIATNETAKLRLRVVPALLRLARQGAPGTYPPDGLAFGLAAYLTWVRLQPDPTRDQDQGLAARHWQEGGEDVARVAASALADAALWGTNLAALSPPGLVEATTRWLARLTCDGVDAALDALLTTKR